MIKWKGALFFIVLIIVVLGISAGCYFIGRSFIAEETPENIVKYYEIIDFSATENYIATNTFINGVPKRSYDVLNILGLDSSYTISSNTEGLLDGSVATFSSRKDYSDTIIKIEKNDFKKEYKVIEGYNIFSAQELYATFSGDILNSRVYLGGNVALQCDIEIKDIYSKYPSLQNKECNICTAYSIFGNGHKFSFDGVTTSHTNKLFEILGSNITVADVVFSGKNINSGESVDLENLYDIGTLISFGSDVKNTSAEVKNCQFLNARRNVYIRNSDVSFSCCFFSHASDNNVYILTNDVKKSNIKFNNSVFSNAVISSILNNCNDVVSSECYPKIEFTGFNDFYAWKELDKVQVASTKDEYGEAINSLVANSFNDKSFTKELYKKDGKTYVNMAMLVICMKNGDANNVAEILGVESANLTKIDVELNAVSKKFLSTATLYGYNNENNVAINATPSDNPYLYYQMRYGR